MLNLITEGKPSDLHPQNLTVKFPFEDNFNQKNLTVAPSEKTRRHPTSRIIMHWILITTTCCKFPIMHALQSLHIWHEI